MTPYITISFAGGESRRPFGSANSNLHGWIPGHLVLACRSVRATVEGSDCLFRPVKLHTVHGEAHSARGGGVSNCDSFVVSFSSS